MSDENVMPDTDMFGAEIVSGESNDRRRATYVEATVERIVDLRARQFSELAASLVAQDRDAADLLLRKLSEALAVDVSDAPALGFSRSASSLGGGNGA